MSKLFFIFLLMTGMVAYAAPKDNELPPQGDQIILKKMFGELIAGKPQCEVELSRSALMGDIQTISEALDKGEVSGKPIRTTQYLVYASIVNSWIRKYKYFELDTNISRKWFSRLEKYLRIMYKFSQQMDIAETNPNKTIFNQLKKQYNDTVDLFLKEAKKPEKPDRRIVEQLHIQKIKEHRQYQEYIRKLRKEEE